MGGGAHNLLLPTS